MAKQAHVFRAPSSLYRERRLRVVQGKRRVLFWPQRGTLPGAVASEPTEGVRSPDIVKVEKSLRWFAHDDNLASTTGLETTRPPVAKDRQKGTAEACKINMMRSIRIVLAALLAASANRTAPADAPKVAKPNIVFISPTTSATATLGVTATKVKTPNVDRLAPRACGSLSATRRRRSARRRGIRF